jgi:hypothetical protein
MPAIYAACHRVLREVRNHEISSYTPQWVEFIRVTKLMGWSMDFAG